jgi:hypothetical protein
MLHSAYFLRKPAIYVLFIYDRVWYYIRIYVYNSQVPFSRNDLRKKLLQIFLISGVYLNHFTLRLLGNKDKLRSSSLCNVP